MKKLTALMILLILALTAACLAEGSETAQPMAYHDYADVMPYRVDNTVSEGLYYVFYNVKDLDAYEDYLAFLQSCGYERYDFQDEEDYSSLVMSVGANTYFYSYYYPGYNQVLMVFFSDQDYGFDPLSGLE